MDAHLKAMKAKYGINEEDEVEARFQCVEAILEEWLIDRERKQKRAASVDADTAPEPTRAA